MANSQALQVVLLIGLMEPPGYGTGERAGSQAEMEMPKRAAGRPGSSVGADWLLPGAGVDMDGAPAAGSGLGCEGLGSGAACVCEVWPACALGDCCEATTAGGGAAAGGEGVAAGGDADGGGGGDELPVLVIGGATVQSSWNSCGLSSATFALSQVVCWLSVMMPPSWL